MEWNGTPCSIYSCGRAGPLTLRLRLLVLVYAAVGMHEINSNRGPILIYYNQFHLSNQILDHVPNLSGQPRCLGGLICSLLESSNYGPPSHSLPFITGLAGEVRRPLRRLRSGPEVPVRERGQESKPGLLDPSAGAPSRWRRRRHMRAPSARLNPLEGRFWARLDGEAAIVLAWQVRRLAGACAYV